MTELQSKSSRRLVALISDVMHNQSQTSGTCSTILAEVNSLLEEDKYVDNVLQESLISLMGSSSVSNECKESIIESLSKFAPTNFQAAVLEIHYLVWLKEFREALQAIEKDPRFETSQESKSIIDLIAVKSGYYEECVLLMAKLGQWIPEVMHAFLETKPGNARVREIADIMKQRSGSQAYVPFLEMAYETYPDKGFRDDLISIYLKQGNPAKLAAITRQLSETEISDSMELSRLAEIFLAGKDMEMAMRFSKKAVVLDPSLLEANLAYLRTLMAAERYEEAYSQIMKIGGEQPRNPDIAWLKVVSAFKTGRYRECIDTINTMSAGSGISKDLLLYSIRSYIGLADYHRALKAIEESSKLLQDDVEILREKFLLEKKFENKGQIFQTAEKLLKLDSTYQEALKFVISMLYDTEEYSRIVDRFAKISSTDPEVLAYVIASYLRVSPGVDGTREALRKARPLINQGIVLDTLFELARSDEFAEILKAEVPLDSEDAWPVTLCLNFLRGKSIISANDLFDKASRIRSIGLMWGLAKSRFYAQNCDIDEKMLLFLSTKPYDILSTTMARIKEIIEGKIPANIRDSRFLMYPVSEALSLTNRYKEAESTLEESVEDKKTDPFYWYISGLIQFNTSDFASSMRSIKKALQIFTNADFLVLKIRAAIRLRDDAQIREAFEKLAWLDETHRAPYAEIREYLASAESGLLSWFAEFLEKNPQQSEEAERILLMEKERIGDISYASKVSRKIMSGKYLKSDLLKHIALLERMSNRAEKIASLREAEVKFRDPQIEIMLANTLCEDGNFQEAYDHFKHAQDLGADISTNRSFAEALLYVRKYKEANELITRNEYWALKIMHLARQHLYKDIITLFHGMETGSFEWKESVNFLTTSLWKNSDIREALFRAFDKSRNRHLGERMATAMQNSGDKVGAIDIRKKILKAYPDESSNISKLATLLAEDGFPSDAIALLNRSLGKIKNPESGREVIDTLLTISYLNGYFSDVVRVYEANPTYINRENIEMIIRSYIERKDYEMAEKIASRYVGTILETSIFDEILKEIGESKHFHEIAGFAAKLLDAEFKSGRVFDMEEAVYKASIPVAKAEEIFQFLTEEGYYADINRPKYEALSRDVIQRAVKKAGLTNIGQLRINVIFNCLDSRDIILAKNLYTYVKECMGKQRIPDAENPYKEKLLKSALRERIRIEPLNIAYNLNIGIDDAMEILTLMNYVLDMSRGAVR